MAARSEAAKGGRRRARTRKWMDSDNPGTARDSAALGRIRADLRSLRRTVENDHDHRLRRIETDLRWVIVLLGGQVVALVGAAATGVLGG